MTEPERLKAVAIAEAKRVIELLENDDYYDAAIIAADLYGSIRDAEEAEDSAHDNP